MIVFASQIYVFHENPDYRFSVWLIHSMESMEAIESMESIGSMESRESMESEVKYIRWWYDMDFHIIRCSLNCF